MLTKRQAAMAVMTTCALPSLIRRAVAQERRSALELINKTPGLSIFAEIIKNHKLEESFTTGRHGYFVPTNPAIEKLPGIRLERLRSDPEAARQTILNHATDFTRVISGFGNDWNEATVVRTLAGRRYTLVVAANKQPRLNDIPIIYMNYRVSNGYCHAIDGILML
jgi:uncharacterized surface protein with fasciclin (FAS1) repeats